MNLAFDSRKKKIVLVGLLSLVSAAVLCGGIYYTWLITPPGQPKTAIEGLRTISSARFERMPDYRKTEYIEQTQKLLEAVPQDQRHAMMQENMRDPSMRESMRTIHENTMTQQMVKFANATPVERTQMLDEIIDKMQSGQGGPGMFGMGMGRGGPPQGGQAGQNNQGRGNRGPGGRGPGGRGNPREHIKRMVQEGNPQRAALRGEFMRAMRERMAQRGIQFNPPGRGGRR